MKTKNKIWDKFLVETKLQFRKLLKENLISEISKYEFDASLVGKKLEAKTNPSDYSFNKIFGEDWRKIYPFPVTNSGNYANERDRILLNYIREIEEKLGWKIDLTQPFGYATKFVKSEVNGKIFETLRKVKLGPLFTKLGKEAEDFWIKNNKFYTSKDNALYFSSQYSLIISRNPVDVLRMSDHDGWTSCHSPHGSYYKCAVDEALEGGGVAYIVSNKDLETISNLQQTEIFKDSERDIDGVIPLARLRIRRFVDENDEDFAVPEERTYGHHFSSFYEVLKNILINEQKDLYEELLKTNVIDLRDWELTGGSYEDTNARSLFGRFFGQGKKIVGTANHKGRRGQAEIWEEEVETLLRIFNNKNLEHVSVWAEVTDYDGNEPFVDYSGEFYIEYPGDIFGEKLFGYDIRSDLRNIVSENSSCYPDDCEVNYDSAKDITMIRFQISDETNGIPNPDDLEGFLVNLKELNEKYEQIFIFVRRYLRTNGFIKDNPYAKIPKLYHFEQEKLGTGVRSKEELLFSTKKRIKVLSGDIFKFKIDPKYPSHLYSDIESSFYDVIIAAMNDFQYNFLRGFFVNFLKEKFLQNIKEYETELNFSGKSSYQSLFSPEETQRNLVLENININLYLSYKDGVPLTLTDQEAPVERVRRILSHGIFGDIRIEYTESFEEKDLQTFFEFIKYIDSNIKNIFVMIARSLYHKLEIYWEQWKEGLEKENMKSMRNDYPTDVDDFSDVHRAAMGRQVGIQQRIFPKNEIPYEYKGYKRL